MTTALCLGGAAGVQEDWATALAMGDFDFIVACNDVGAIWPGKIDIWCSLHPEKLGVWRDQRRANGHPDAARYLVHGHNVPLWSELVEFRFPGQGDSGSSGMFTAKAALIDLGADRAVLAGIPMSRAPHFFDNQTWQSAGGYREIWKQVPAEYRSRIRSMSGWTAEFLGYPTSEWLASGSTIADVPAPQEIISMPTKIALDKIAYEPHPVSPERKRELNAKGYKIMDIRFAPADYVAPQQDPDDEPRAAIESKTGKAPRRKAGRAKPTEQYSAAKTDPQDETASNGLTRREIEADLTAMEVDFDSRDSVEDLLALRDMVREERASE